MVCDTGPPTEILHLPNFFLHVMGLSLDSHDFTLLMSWYFSCLITRVFACTETLISPLRRLVLDRLKVNTK